MLGIADKALAIGGGALSLVLGGALIFTVISKNAEISALDKSINDPVTGYAAKLSAATANLATCRGNAITLKAAIDEQHAKLAAAKLATDRRLDALSRQLDSAKAAQASAERRAASILSAQPTGDICTSADALILENL